MELGEIHSFVSVVRAGSFTKAGKQRGVPKSTLSRQVSRLEQRLGAQLLKRSTRRLSLTEDGRAFYERCLHAIEEIENAERGLLDATGKPTGTLRVSTSMDLARDYLAPLLPEFRQLYPDVSLDIEMSHRHVDLIAEGFDLALRGGILNDSNLIARRLGNSRIILVASPGYLDHRGRPTTVDELADHDGLMIRQLLSQGRARVQGPDGWVALPLPAWLACNDFSVLCRAALDGLGIALMENNMARPHIAAGRLEQLLPDYGLGAGGGLFAVYPSTHHLTPKVRVFVDFLLERLGPQFGLGDDATT